MAHYWGTCGCNVVMLHWGFDLWDSVVENEGQFPSQIKRHCGSFAILEGRKSLFYAVTSPENYRQRG
jgi:hypothetical protein